MDIFIWIGVICMISFIVGLFTKNKRIREQIIELEIQFDNVSKKLDTSEKTLNSFAKRNQELIKENQLLRDKILLGMKVTEDTVANIRSKCNNLYDRVTLLDVLIDDGELTEEQTEKLITLIDTDIELNKEMLENKENLKEYHNRGRGI